MKAIIRKDEDAVSPVIATILMVAITVVLAAVLYVMVSGLITGPGNAPKSIGATISVSSDGTNYIVLFTSVPLNTANSTVSISISTASGGTALAATPLNSAAALQTAHIVYSPATTTGSLAANDKILIQVSSYPSSDTVTLTSGGSIWFGPQAL